MCLKSSSANPYKILSIFSAVILNLKVPTTRIKITGITASHIDYVVRIRPQDFPSSSITIVKIQAAKIVLLNTIPLQAGFFFAVMAGRHYYSLCQSLSIHRLLFLSIYVNNFSPQHRFFFYSTASQFSTKISKSSQSTAPSPSEGAISAEGLSDTPSHWAESVAKSAKSTCPSWVMSAGLY